MASTLLFILLLFLNTYSINYKVKPLNIAGLVAPVFSPFDENLKLNLSVVPLQAAFLNSTGVNYAFIAGSTGESVSLSQSEREQLLEAWINVAPIYNMNIIVHVGANCIEESRQLTYHALSLNSSYLVAFASMATSYFKPATIGALIELMKDIASAAPNLPFYYYHIPSQNGVEFSMYDFLTSAVKYIDNLVGIKFTGLYQSESSFPDIIRILNWNKINNINKSIEILVGRDEMMLQALISGVIGFVGTTYTFAGELYNKLIYEYNNGNINNARELQLYSDNLIFEVAYNLSSGKNGFKYMKIESGINVGQPRPPFLKMNQNDMQIEETNTLIWCTQTNDILSWCKNLRQRVQQRT